MSKRDFLRTLVVVSVTAFEAKALAISILEDLQKNQPNEFEKDLIRNPRKQILIAEKMSCPFGGGKAKCIAEE